MKYRSLGAVALSLAVAACGTTTEERVATGGIGGALIGIAGGPIGVAIGFGAGVAAGYLTPIGADQFVREALNRPATPPARAEAETAPPAPATAGTTTKPESLAGTSRPPAAAPRPRTASDTAKLAQAKLKSDGYDPGPIDGLVGPKTKAALVAYQRDHGLPQTSTLDQQTVNSLSGEAQPGAGRTEPGAPGAQPKAQ